MRKLRIPIASNAPIFMCLYDEDVMEFKVVGPFLNDMYWVKRMTELRESGRKVRCSEVSTEIDIQREIKDFESTCEYRRNDKLQF